MSTTIPTGVDLQHAQSAYLDLRAHFSNHIDSIVTIRRQLDDRPHRPWWDSWRMTDERTSTHFTLEIEYYSHGETHIAEETFPWAYLDLSIEDITAREVLRKSAMDLAEAERKATEAAARAAWLETQERAELARLASKYPPV